MQTAHQDDRAREQQQQRQQADAAGAPQAQAVDLATPTAPPSARQIDQTLSAGLPGYAEGTAALAQKLAREQTSQAGVDALAANRGALWSDVVAAWRAAATQDERFVKQFGNSDPIAQQKFRDVDGERYYEGGIDAVKPGFYGAVAAEVQTAPIQRDRIFPLMQRAAGSYKFKGTKIPGDQLAAMSRRTHGVGTLYSYALSARGASIVDTWARAELATAAGMTPVEAANAGLLPDDKAKLEALKHLLRTTYAGDAKGLAEPSASLARAETWYSPAEVTVRPADPDMAFADMMTVGALQPEWYADGALDLTIEPTGMREARKPTAFDGMMSALWVSRNQDDQTYGVTGGGAREFLERGVTWAAVKSAVPVIPSDTWMAELARLNAAVKASAPGSSVGEELLRGNDPGVAATAPAYEQVFDRSLEEAQAPTTVPGQSAPVGGAAMAPGGTFDTTRTPAPLHANPVLGAAPAPAPAPATPLPVDPGAAASDDAGTVAASAPTPTTPAAGSDAIRGDTAAPPPAPASTTPAAAAVAPQPQAPANPDVSRHAIGAAPGDWRAREIAAVPSAQVMPDDPGHVYHVLDDGDVVATTTPARVDPTAARAARAAAPTPAPAPTTTAARAAPAATAPAAPTATAAPATSAATPAPAPAAAAAPAVAPATAPSVIPPKPTTDVEYKALAGWAAFSANVQSFGLPEATALKGWKLAMDQLYTNQQAYDRLRSDPAAMTAWVDSDPARVGFRAMADDLLAAKPLDTSRTYALWSGKPAHEYAQTQGHEVLESVAIGKLFDDVRVVFREWNVMKTLWRAISDVYARKIGEIMQGHAIHVYQRKLGDIFAEVESKALAELADSTGVPPRYVFHPLVVTGAFGGEAEYEKPYANGPWRDRLTTAAAGDKVRAQGACEAVGVRLFSYTGIVPVGDLRDAGATGSASAAAAVMTAHNQDVDARCTRAESALLTAAGPAATPGTSV